MSSELRIAGWQPVSLIDYPGKVASVIFLAGCNWRCHYCHNPQLWYDKANTLPFERVMGYLRANRSLLDGVVISGGEPTLCPYLPQLLRTIKQLGLAVKLDTNGSRPAVVRRLVRAGLVDFVALDVKAPAAKHLAITGQPLDPVLVTARWLKSQTAVPYLFRTTLTPRLTVDDMVTIGKEIINGATIWQIQQCRIDGAYSGEKVQKIALMMKKYAQDIVVRGL